MLEPDKYLPQKKYNYKRRRSQPELYMFINAQERARRKGLEFSIEKKDIAIPEYCPILGIKIEIPEHGRGDGSPSLDRIDNSLGYIKNNIRVISWRANHLKSDATNHELQLMAKFFYDNNPSEIDADEYRLSL